jgi:hypothetical protein
MKASNIAETAERKSRAGWQSVGERAINQLLDQLAVIGADPKKMVTSGEPFSRLTLVLNGKANRDAGFVRCAPRWTDIVLVMR